MIPCPYCDRIITYLEVEDAWDFAECPPKGYFIAVCEKCKEWLNVEVRVKPVFTISRWEEEDKS